MIRVKGLGLVVAGFRVQALRVYNSLGFGLQADKPQVSRTQPGHVLPQPALTTLACLAFRSFGEVLMHNLA